MSKKFPDQADDWQFSAEEGHVCVSLRRGVSERASILATKAGVKHSTESVEIYLSYYRSKGEAKEPKDNSHTSGTGLSSPLWYRWKTYKLDQRFPEVQAKKGDEVTLLIVKAEETTEGVKEPRKATMMLKAVFGAEKKP